MIAHVVLFRPKQELPMEERRLLVGAFERAVREIGTVRNVRLGRRVTFGAGYEQRMAEAADYLIVIDFDDLEGLRTYLQHPAHEELGARFNESVSSTLIYDFELGPLEDLL